MSDTTQVEIYDPKDIRSLPGERVVRRDLSSMPSDMVTVTAARSELDARQFGVWSLLRVHLYEYGCLPTGYPQLAKIGKVGRIAFERMAPTLVRHFDRDRDKRWTDRDLMRARGDRVVIEIGPESPRPKSERRQIAGRFNVLKRWRPELFDEHGAVRPERKAEYETAMLSIVRGHADDSKEGQSADPLDVVSVVSASSAPSKLASLLSLGKQDQDSEVASLLSFEADLASKLAARAPATDSKLDAVPANSKPVAEAIGTPAEGEAALVQCLGNVARSEIDPVKATSPQPSDAAIIDAVIEACTQKISKTEVHVRLPVYRDALAEGLDFYVDILPNIKSFARKKDRVENCANTHIMADAREHFRSRIAVQALKPNAVRPVPLKVNIDLVQNRSAWRLYLLEKKKKSLPTTITPDGTCAHVEEQLWADCLRRAQDLNEATSPHRSRGEAP